MRVVRHEGELPQAPASSVVTIGNFDGVHIAHRELFRRVVESARKKNALAVAMTFDPHPAQVLSPERVPAALTPLETKISLIGECGIDLLYVVAFTQQVAHLSPAEFVQRFLVGQLRAAEVQVGVNFCFGRGRQGNVEILARLGLENNFGVATLPLLEVRGQRVSSSRIRNLIAEGRIALANRLLGRPFAAEGTIVSGEGIGRKRAVPTLNLAPVQQQLPGTGVYVTRTQIDGRVMESVTNVGYKPTFGAHPLTIESFLLNSTGEINASRMRIEFLHRLRDEKKFPDAAALKAQIEWDVRCSIKYFSLASRFIHSSRTETASPTRAS